MISPFYSECVSNGHYTQIPAKEQEEKGNGECIARVIRLW
jgi:hypothetical protein